MKKKIIAFVVIVALIVSMLPMVALATTEETCTVSGRVQNSEGAILEGAYVSFYITPGESLTIAQTGPTGDFSLAGIPKNVKGTVIISLNNYKSKVFNMIFTEDSFDFNIIALESGTNFIVWFETDGGSSVATQAVDSGSYATKPADPTKTGSTFGGWYKNEACTDVFDFDNTQITQDTTIYAKWTKEQTYTVTFESNGGSVVATQSVEKDGIVKEPENPTKEGYIFDGWYKDKDCTTAWDFDQDTVSADIILYAKWISASNIIDNVAVTVPTITVGDKIADVNNKIGISGTYKDILEITGINWNKKGSETTLEDTYVFEKGVTYEAEICMSIKDAYANSYKFKEEFQVEINGTKYTGKIDEQHETIASVITEATPAVIYSFIDNADKTGVTYVKSSGKGLTVKCEGEYSKFQKLLIDGVVVDSSKYTVAQGSTVVTLKTDYLDTLTTGKHILKITYTDGESAPVEITVQNATVKTGDETNVALMIGIIAMAGAAIAIIGFRFRKQH